MPTETEFQIECLAVISGLQNTEETSYGLRIRRELSEWRGEEVNHGRLYPNLDTLVERGYVTVAELDKRTNEYSLTDDGKARLDSYLTQMDDMRSGEGISAPEASA